MVPLLVGEVEVLSFLLGSELRLSNTLLGQVLQRENSIVELIGFVQVADLGECECLQESCLNSEDARPGNVKCHILHQTGKRESFVMKI